MADDPNPPLRAELTAALAVLAPQIRGLRDLASAGVSISDDLRADIVDEVNKRDHRYDLIHRVLDALDDVVANLQVLEADGYPRLDPMTITTSRFEELKEEMTDVQAAASVFRADMATGFSIAAGAPEDKPLPSAVEKSPAKPKE
jgi:hypothetical protein